MSVWFEGTREISCTLDEVQQALSDPMEYYLEVIRLMPGLTRVELVDWSDDSLTIETNEGLMRRSNLNKRTEASRVTVDFEEVYDAGSRVTVRSRFRDEFIPSDTGVRYRLAISDVDAPGFAGFMYRRFGSSKMGEAFLSATQAHLEG